MLVMTRKPGEQLVIGDGVRISLVAVKGNRVRLGITAPLHIRIERGEVWKRVEATKGK